MSADWISAREAARRLDVKLQTLYAYASRGLVESVPAPTGRGRHYARSSIERLKARHDARAGHGAVAASALRWGEPSLETSISDIRADGPAYRGESALALCESAPSFESVAMLLWTGRLGEARFAERPLAKLPLPPRPRTPSASAYLAAAVSLAALADEGRHGAGEADEHARARRVLPWLAAIVGGARKDALRDASVAAQLFAGFGVRASEYEERLLDRALILCADHELNASTFATRVAASTGADLYACLGAGLHALSGPKHGGVAARFEALLAALKRPASADEVVRARLARGEEIPGFGHMLYPEGDPRARPLLALARRARRGRATLARIDALIAAMARAGQPLPNFDTGLVALTHAVGLPAGATPAVFAIGRTAGWVAHALEQRAQGFILRPRARYVPAAARMP